VASTRTRSASQTGTLTNIVYVARKIQADFLAILDTYGYFTEEWGLQVMHDVRVLMDEEVLDRVYLVWARQGTNEVLDAFSYKVIAAGVGLADDRSGNIRYRPELTDADFTLRVDYKSRWWMMPEAEWDQIRAMLDLPWGSGGWLDFSRGRWQADKTYSKDGYGVSRERFVR
jgi:hypothetical protein